MSKEKGTNVDEKEKQSKKQQVLFSFYVYAFVFVLVSMIYILSPLSYVSEVKVSGNERVSKEEIIVLSEITSDTRFWSGGYKEKAKRIKQQREEIAEVEIQRKFINRVQINIVEYEKVAYLLKDGKGYPVLSNGAVLLEDEQENIGDSPLLVNWVEGEELRGITSELAKTSTGALEMISEIHHTPTDINPLHISVYMTDGNEVSGTITEFASKISDYPIVSAKVPEGVKGVFDMEVGYVLKPY